MRASSLMTDPLTLFRLCVCHAGLCFDNGRRRGFHVASRPVTTVSRSHCDESVWNRPHCDLDGAHFRPYLGVHQVVHPAGVSTTHLLGRLLVLRVVCQCLLPTPNVSITWVKVDQYPRPFS